VGQPPFFTSSLYSLIQLIVHDPITFPDSMSPLFRSFLSGLLTKKPADRLAWPQLADHPFLTPPETGPAAEPPPDDPPRPLPPPSPRIRRSSTRPSLRGEACEAEPPRPSRAQDAPGHVYLPPPPAGGVGGPPSRELASLEAAAEAVAGDASAAALLRADASLTARLLAAAGGGGADAASALRSLSHLLSSSGGGAGDALGAAAPPALAETARGYLGGAGGVISTAPLLASSLELLALLLPPPPAQAPLPPLPLCRLAAEALRQRGDPLGAVAAAAACLAEAALAGAAGGRAEGAAAAAAALNATALLPELARSLALLGSGSGQARRRCGALRAIASASLLPGCRSAAASAALAAGEEVLLGALGGADGPEAAEAGAALVARCAGASRELARTAEAAVWGALARAAGGGGPGSIALLDAAASLCEAAGAEEEEGAAGAAAAAAAHLLATSRLASVAALLSAARAARDPAPFPAAARLLAAPFAAADAGPGPSAAAAQQVQLRAYEQALLQHALPQTMSGALEVAPPRLLPAPVALLVRLSLASPAFGDAFVAGGGLGAGCVAAALHQDAPPAAAADFLLLLSQLARGSGAHHATLCAAGLAPHLARLASGGGGAPAAVRARACNAAGNLCRHGPGFYAEALRAGLPAALAAACADPDGATRKFAAFALGNAAFHSDELYCALACAAAPLAALLQDGEDKTRANAAGALGNLARNSDALAPALLAAAAPDALLGLLQASLEPAAAEAPEAGCVRIALFSVGNLCAHGALKQRLLRLGVRELAGRLAEEAPNRDAATRRYAQRVLAKLAGTPSKADAAAELAGASRHTPPPL